MKTLFVTICSLFVFGSVSAMITPNDPPKTQYNDINNSCRERGVTVTYEAGGRNIKVDKPHGSTTEYNISTERTTGARTNYDSRTDITSFDSSGKSNKDGKANISRIDIQCFDKSQGR